MIRNVSLFFIAAVILTACSGEGPADLMDKARSLEEDGKTDEALTLYETVFKQHEAAAEAPEALFRSAHL
ncbi:MAG TPA: hypothetical protein ENN65_06800, partial [Candidatus Hydrogenedentes bacterium]|nr:hypothetical protein [Candidatus Hydrogenedentota bacterium]